MTNRSNRVRLAIAACIVLWAGWSDTLSAQDENRIERFSGHAPGEVLPAGWGRQSLPKVERDNRFELVEDGGVTVLQVRSERSASTLFHRLDADPARTPLLRWRWKVSNVVAGSDLTRREGDDYAAKVYVLFDYPSERLSLGTRLQMTLARTLYGAQLPAAAITYVWGTAQPAGASAPNAYTDRVRMQVVESGAEQVGQWVEVERNLALDFERLFGETAPKVVGIAVSADTDNTGEAVTAWFGDLRLSGVER